MFLFYKNFLWHEMLLLFTGFCLPLINFPFWFCGQRLAYCPFAWEVFLFVVIHSLSTWFGFHISVRISWPKSAGFVFAVVLPPVRIRLAMLACQGTRAYLGASGAVHHFGRAAYTAELIMTPQLLYIHLHFTGMLWVPPRPDPPIWLEVLASFCHLIWRHCLLSDGQSGCQVCAFQHTLALFGLLGVLLLRISSTWAPKASGAKPTRGSDFLAGDLKLDRLTFPGLCVIDARQQLKDNKSLSSWLRFRASTMCTITIRRLQIHNP